MIERRDVLPVIGSDRWAGALPRPTDKKPSMRIFGLVMLVGFGILGGINLWAWHRTGVESRLLLASVLIGTGTIVFVISVVAPRSLPPVYGAWMRFGEGIGTLVSTVLLGAAYFLVVTPVGWLMRATGTDPLERRLTRKEGTYWKQRAKPPMPQDYRHMS